MQLPSKALRDSYGIDSFQRAIAFSALLLRYGYQLSSTNAIKDAVQLAVQVSGTGDTFTQNLVIRVGLTVDNDALNSGGNILNNISERFNGSVDWTGSIASPSIGDYLPMAVEPTGLSLEQYFYWACQQFLASEVTDYKKVQITPIFRGLTEPFALDCVVTLAIDYVTYLETNSLISAIGAIANATNQGFTNNTQLNNLLQLGN